MAFAYPPLTTPDGPDRGMEYRGTADREAGHEWWPTMVSDNETWYACMDEGFNV